MISLNNMLENGYVKKDMVQLFWMFDMSMYVYWELRGGFHIAGIGGVELKDVLEVFGLDGVG